MRRNQKGKDPLNKEKAVDSCDHAQNPPQILLSLCIVFVIMTVSAIMEAEDLQRRQRRKQLAIEYLSTCVLLDSQTQRMVQWLCVLYLWYEVQQCVSWEGSHCQAHKQLQDECIRFLAGVEEDQADAEHGAHSDEQDGSRAVAVFCRKERASSLDQFLFCLSIKIKDSGWS